SGVVFVFPGQGSQWVGMSRELRREERVFREALERCDAALHDVVGWSLLRELDRPAAESRMHDVDVVQPALFAMEVALAALWRSWGVEPAAVVGHSLGEVAAACVAGALSIEDGARVIGVRSRLVRGASGSGGMAAVEMEPAALEETIAKLGRPVEIAAVNGPRSCLVSGDVGALTELVEALEKREVFCRRVAVDYASHSTRMEPLLAALRAELADVTPRPAAVAFHSTVEAVPVDGRRLNAAYW